MIVIFELIFFVFVVSMLVMFAKRFLFKNWFDNDIIKNSPITQPDWDEAYRHLPILKGLSSEEKKRLEEFSILFMHQKVFEGAQGFEVTPHMLLVISLQACLPILNLGLDCYKNFSTIIVYPAGFKTNRKETDENGIVDHDRTHTLGESWLRGPVILSWDDSKAGGMIDGSNLVIHEFAHKLDMQNGVANGFPPMHKGVNRSNWVKGFTKLIITLKINVMVMNCMALIVMPPRILRSSFLFLAKCFLKNPALYENTSQRFIFS